jgi:hypothetical protein
MMLLKPAEVALSPSCGVKRPARPPACLLARPPALLPACLPACLSAFLPDFACICMCAIILLQLEKAQKSPARVQLLFERVVASFPVTSQLWLQYGRYLESEIKVHDVINKVRLQHLPRAVQLMLRTCVGRGRWHVRHQLC